MAIRIPVLLLALTVHEFSHAYSAYRLGDRTAYLLGRCTLNPLKHLDPLGAICLLFAPIGWAKPVPVNPLNFRNPGRDDIIVSLAGPVSNLIQAFFFALLLRVLGTFATSLVGVIGLHGFQAVAWFGFVGVLINVGLAVFNLIPAYPLDGFHVFSNLAKGQSRQRILEMARYGPYMIMGLVLLSNSGQVNPLGYMIRPVREFFLERITGVEALQSLVVLVGM